MYESEKRAVLDCALTMEHYRLVSLSGGNVSMRLPDGTFLVTPTAVRYDSMRPDDIVRVDAQGKVVEGCLRPSSDTSALLFVFKHMPTVNAVIHTHQPYATAAGLVTDVLPAFLTLMIDATQQAVHVAPFTISSDEGMGALAVEYARGALCVILKDHGVMAFGKDLDQALEAAVYLEDAARIYLLARAVGPVPLLDEKQIAEQAEDRGNYGQKK